MLFYNKRKFIEFQFVNSIFSTNRDPSGLAPEGEKNNKTQGLGDDAIVAGQTIGYWSLQNTLYIDYRAVRDFEDSRGTSYVYSFSMSTSLEESYVWVTTRGIGGISDTRAGSASIDSPSEMWGTDRYRGSTSTKKYIDPNSLRSKSMRDQIYNEASFGNQSGSMVSISTSVCVGCENNNSSNFKTPDYNLYTKDGELNPNFKGDGLESNDLNLIGLYSFTKALLKNGVKSLSKLIFGNNAAKGVTNLIPEGNLANHLFKGSNKLADNPANRALIQEVSNSKALVVDNFGKSWFRGVDAAGNGIYSYTQNGVVKGAGYTDFNAKQLINHIINTVGIK